MEIALRPVTEAHLPAIRGLLTAACLFDPAAEVAREKVFGPAPGDTDRSSPLAAFRGDDLVGIGVPSQRWIRLLAVAPDARRRGIGTALLAAMESHLAAAGATRARTLDQPGNYLAPGIDVSNVETIAWLERRGYRPIAENTNIVVDLAGNPLVSAARAAELSARAAAAGYRVRRARPAEEREGIIAWIAHHFSAPWAHEVDLALDQPPPAVHLAIERATGEMAAFAAHDGNNRGLGWFGPAGTLVPHRSKGLGEALLVACLVDVADAGRDACTVAWIGPRAFYERAAGIAAERRFLVLGKVLGGDAS